MNDESIKNVDHYLALPYGTTLRRDEEDDWVAKIEELPGCTAHGATKSEALENLEEVQRAWIEDALAAGDEVPEPYRNEGMPSGKWLQRVPRTLHKKLAELAIQEGTSLNQLATSILAEAVGRRSVSARITRSHESHEAIWSYYTKQSPNYIEWEMNFPGPKRIKILDVLSGTVAALPNEIIYPTKTVSTRAKKKEIESFKA